MLRRFTLATIAIVAIASFPKPATAATFVYSISGTVSPDYSFDDMMIFGGGDLGGVAFVATFVVDDANPSAVYAYGATGSSAAGGGQFRDGTTPPVGATLTIRGISYAVRTGNDSFGPVTGPDGDPVGPSRTEQDLGTATKDGAAGSLQLGAGYSRSDSCCFPVFYASETGDGLDFVLRSPALSAADYRQTGVFQLAPGSSGGSFGTSQVYTDRQGQSINFTTLSLIATTLTVSSAIPESSSWALTIGGLGIAGAMVRRRRAGAIVRFA